MTGQEPTMRTVGFAMIGSSCRSGAVKNVYGLTNIFAAKFARAVKYAPVGCDVRAPNAEASGNGI
jgi:hypothetical protein